MQIQCQECLCIYYDMICLFCGLYDTVPQTSPLGSATPCRLMLQTLDNVTSHDPVAHPCCLRPSTIFMRQICTIYKTIVYTLFSGVMINKLSRSKLKKMYCFDIRPC